MTLIPSHIYLFWQVIPSHIPLLVGTNTVLVYMVTYVWFVLINAWAWILRFFACFLYCTMVMTLAVSESVKGNT